MVLFFGMIAFVAVAAIFILAVAFILAFGDYLAQGLSFYEWSAVVTTVVFFIVCYYGPRVIRAVNRRQAEKEKRKLAQAQARYVGVSSDLGRENPGYKAFFRAFRR